MIFHSFLLYRDSFVLSSRAKRTEDIADIRKIRSLDMYRMDESSWSGKSLLQVFGMCVPAVSPQSDVHADTHRRPSECR